MALSVLRLGKTVLFSSLRKFCQIEIATRLENKISFIAHS